MVHGCHRNGLTCCRSRCRLSARLCTNLGRWFGRRLSSPFGTRLAADLTKLQSGMQPLWQVVLFWDISYKTQVSIKNICQAPSPTCTLCPHNLRLRLTITDFNTTWPSNVRTAQTARQSR